MLAFPGGLLVYITFYPSPLAALRAGSLWVWRETFTTSPHWDKFNAA